MPLIKLHPAVAKNLLNYLENVKKRAEFVIAKPDRYDRTAIKRAEHVVSLLTPVIDALKNPVGVSGEDAIKPSEQPQREENQDRIQAIEDRIKALEEEIKGWKSWQEIVNAHLKKLLAYHTGDIV